MRVALRNSYIEFVVYTGVAEKYPPWFAEELYAATYTDESRFTFWVPIHQRTPDYYEKELVEDYSIFLRKSNGELHVTDYDTFTDLYVVFKYNAFTNSGMAALEEDCIEYVEAQAGVLPAGYPEWFYEYFTEAINFPQDGETVYFFDDDENKLTASRGSITVTAGGEATITDHCVFLRNKFGEIRGMDYDKFLLYYDPEPNTGGWMDAT
jgi:hypothetical protein